MLLVIGYSVQLFIRITRGPIEISLVVGYIGLGNTAERRILN